RRARRPALSAATSSSRSLEVRGLQRQLLVRSVRRRRAARAVVADAVSGIVAGATGRAPVAPAGVERSAGRVAETAAVVPVDVVAGQRGVVEDLGPDADAAVRDRRVAGEHVWTEVDLETDLLVPGREVSGDDGVVALDLEPVEVGDGDVPRQHQGAVGAEADAAVLRRDVPQHPVGGLRPGQADGHGEARAGVLHGVVARDGRSAGEDDDADLAAGQREPLSGLAEDGAVGGDRNEEVRVAPAVDHGRGSALLGLDGDALVYVHEAVAPLLERLVPGVAHAFSVQVAVAARADDDAVAIGRALERGRDGPARPAGSAAPR